MKYFYILPAFVFSISMFGVTGQVVNTIAGGFNGTGSPATSIGINPQNHVVDINGNIFISDPDKHLVRKLSANGTFSVVAGNGTYGFSGDGGPANSAQLKNPGDIAMDASGNLFIADGYDNRIRKVAANGVISTIAGNGTEGFSGDGGAAINAQLDGPNGLAVDAAGNIFITDFGNNRVRKVAVNGIISTVAGTGAFGFSGDGGPATSANLGYPIGVAVDVSGNLFISDLANNRVRKVSNEMISTVAGSGGIGTYSGDGGLATSAQFNAIAGNIAVDAAGNIYIPDSKNNRIRKVGTNGIVTTIAGNGGSGFSGDGSPATSAQLYNPTGVSVDGSGNIFISTNYRIRKVDANGLITTIAGNGTGGFSGDAGPALLSQLYYPSDLSTDVVGNIIIADAYNSRIRQVAPNGTISTLAGNGSAGFSGDGGPAISAQLNYPCSVVKDLTGNTFIADAFNSRIRKIDINGAITTVAGNGVRGFSGDGGLGNLAQLSYPSDLATDAAGNVFFADRDNYRIRKLATNGLVSTMAGNGTAGFSGDGGPATSAQINIPLGVAVDAAGNILFSDPENHRIRRVGVDGIISTVAGNGTAGFSGDGASAVAAQLQDPLSVTSDGSGNIYISDNDRIRRISPSGIISTVVGGGSDAGEGVSAMSSDLSTPPSVVVDGSGNILIVDQLNHRIRKISMSSLPLTLLYFTIARDNNSIINSWQTTNEVNTANFCIQRSPDGHSFTTVGMVQAAGESNNARSYSYTDASISGLYGSRLYYRLLMADKDGRITYSKIETITLPGKAFVLKLSPNPAHGTVLVEGDNIKKISVADYAGKVLIQQFTNDNQTAVNISGLKKGVYIVKAHSATGVIRSVKMVVQ